MTLNQSERKVISDLWSRKVDQDAHKLPKQERHRNIEPISAEFICALAIGVRAARLLEIGGSSGISTIALAVAARATGGRLVSIEIEPVRQAEAKKNISSLGLAEFVDFRLGDATSVIPGLTGLNFVLIDCEKEDYIRFFDMLPLSAGAVIAADNVLLHNLTDYIEHVRAMPNTESITLPIGKGLEVTHYLST